MEKIFEGCGLSVQREVKSTRERVSLLRCVLAAKRTHRDRSLVSSR